MDHIQPVNPKALATMQLRAQLASAALLIQTLTGDDELACQDVLGTAPTVPPAAPTVIERVQAIE